MKNLNAYLFLLMILILTSCGSKKIGFDKSPVIEQNPNKSVPLAAILKYKAKQSVSVTANFVSADHVFSLKFDTITDAVNGIALIGMKAGRTYAISLQINTKNKSI